MKKKLYAVILAALISAPSFARETSNAVFVDAGIAVLSAIYNGFGVGIGYEHALSDGFSVVLNGSGFNLDYDNEAYFGMNAGLHTRCYLFSNAVKGLFMDIGGAYAYTSIEHNSQTAVSHTFELSAMAGWKIVFGKTAGLFLEPGYGYAFNFGKINRPAGVSSLKNTPSNGQRLWIGLGFAF
ncbi:MAG: hypothetical protein LBJ35_07225 [Spirochaetaceae bacterium]|jgi:hypothetical protein|nr:hypothetical protein [Spirochaetaceae bacterium]